MFKPGLHPGLCSQDLTLKLCLIRSICMISQAICKGGKCGDFSFSRKAELVAQMVVRGALGLAWGGLGVPKPHHWGLHVAGAAPCLELWS